MKLVIKDMVCPRCIMVVENLLNELGIKAQSVLLGEVLLTEKPDEEQLQKLKAGLLKFGFELLNDPNKQLVENIKNLIIQKVQSRAIEPHFCLSGYLKNKTLKDYSTLTKVFSEEEGCTIEKFFILLKVEKAKELLYYRQLTIKEIATKLGYSSCQHLSMQFKKVTNYSPKEFKTRGVKDRKTIDKVIPSY
jgi:AraC family transcriptional regulator